MKTAFHISKHKNASRGTSEHITGITGVGHFINISWT